MCERLFLCIFTHPRTHTHRYDTISAVNSITESVSGVSSDEGDAAAAKDSTNKKKKKKKKKGLSTTQLTLGAYYRVRDMSALIVYV
jgi:hypothetical protein